MQVTIGLTRTDRDNDYIPAIDGYREGAKQDSITLEIDTYGHYYTPVEIAEAIFIATYAPRDVAHDSYLPSLFWEEIWKYIHGNRATSNFYRAVSVGDTVTVDGQTMACARVGWLYL